MTLLLLLLAIGWMALHWWLGRRGYRRTLGALSILDAVLFVLLWVHLHNDAASNPSNGMGRGLAFFGGVLFLALPALVGAGAFWKFRRVTAEHKQEFD
ncbi:hypothetical protein D2V17_00400 [Aurantiacibacter xanthus]|uniref:Uncharacterized protein n=1 Tax=Aurantiacibacter xanthus TaxID=1784712 RepID=A0A3A1PHV0_9SPHN|nr:hypothetical protein [Aurantiacibacter xanthus]RIV93457.1 hypothetical protein D2V17_00400 [Aurantiacibacter xanthus]